MRREGVCRWAQWAQQVTTLANQNCALCGTPMIVGTWLMYGWLTSEVIGITCPRKYCGQNMIERQIYDRRRNDPFRSPKIAVYRRFCGL